MSSIQHRLQFVLAEIAAAAERVGRRPEDITLVCVSKKRSVGEMTVAAEYILSQGREVIFGESYVQEFEKKREDIKEPCKVHLIGPLQSNKAAKAAQIFDLIESVHSEKILRAIDKEAQKLGKIMPIYIQVNISRDAQKSGFDENDLANLFANVLPQCKAVNVQGLMTITENYENAEAARADFKKHFQLCLHYSQQLNTKLACSMGMSADYAIAIEEGATHVRIGSAIFSS